MEKEIKKNKEEPKKTVHKGLYQKPMRKQGGLIGSRSIADSFENKSTLDIEKQKKGAIRVLFFGGVEEVGKNMYALEYEDEIIILDCGVKFTSESTPGITFIAPNVQYLEERKEKIKAMIVSHGHLDHIGGISILMDRLGNPPIFSRRLSIELIKNRQSEFESKKPLVCNEVEKDSVIKLSENITLSFFAVTHTIPDSMGTIIDFPIGSVVFTGDLKLTHVDGVVDKDEEREFSAFKNKKVLLTMADSTNADRPGFSLPESKVLQTIEGIIKKTNGRIILSSFASQLERNLKIIEDAIKNGRKIVVQGRSMFTSLNVASELGLLKVPMNAIIPVDKMGDYPSEKILVLATGAQGNPFSALDRMSQEKHRHIKLGKSDTIVFSASIVPGNEEPVQNLKNRLSRSGVNMITYQTSDVHSSGHANRDELEWIHRKIDARFFTPLHGYHYMLSAHGQILQDIGMPKENIVIPDNGSIVDISPDGKTIKKQEYSMPTKVIVIDGNSIGSVQTTVLNERKMLREDGIFVVIILVNKTTRKVKKSPDIISRGLIYLQESFHLINRVRSITTKVANQHMEKNQTINIESLKRAVKKDVQRFIYSETKKRPIIATVVYIN